MIAAVAVLISISCIIPLMSYDSSAEGDSDADYAVSIETDTQGVVVTFPDGGLKVGDNVVGIAPSAEGGTILTLEFNGADVLDKLVDGKITLTMVAGTINKIAATSDVPSGTTSFSVDYRLSNVNLVPYASGPGSVTHTITAISGANITTLTFNGADVLGQLVNGKITLVYELDKDNTLVASATFPGDDDGNLAWVIIAVIIVAAVLIILFLFYYYRYYTVKPKDGEPADEAPKDEISEAKPEEEQPMDEQPADEGPSEEEPTDETSEDQTREEP